MSEDSFILMNLKDSKDIAAAMQNETAQKILDFLTRGSATESEIATGLELPMSTVHYNLQQLKKAKLVKTDEYHYSKKGKEILHYKLAKKLIIIAPAGDESNWKELLKKIIPAFGIVAVIGYITRFFGNGVNQADIAMKTEVMGAGVDLVRSALVAEAMLADTADNMMVNPVTEHFWSHFSSFEWFILGAIAIIGILLILELFAQKQWFKSKKH